MSSKVFFESVTENTISQRGTQECSGHADQVIAGRHRNRLNKAVVRRQRPLIRKIPGRKLKIPKKAASILKKIVHSVR